MKIVVALLLAAAAWYFFSSLERRSLYFPDRILGGDPHSFGMPFDAVRLKATDGVRVAAWWIPAEPSQRGPAPLTVLFCHGNAGNISHRLEKARLLHQLGLNVFLFDYRGYGESEGKPSEKGAYADAEAAYRFLTEVRGLSAERIVFYGESLGCAVATEMAARHPGAALILESPFTSTVDMARLVFPWLPVRWMVRDRYDNLKKIGRVEAPLLILHSPEDEVVPFAMGKTLFQASASAKKRFVELRGGHNDGFMATGTRYSRVIVEFLTQEDAR